MSDLEHEVTVNKMEWTEGHDVLLCRDILVVEPYKVKERSPQRGIMWDKIAENLNKIKVPLFKVDKRSVRDHFNKVLVVRHKKKMSEEKKASGINPEQSELDAIMEEILERIQAAEENLQVENEQTRRKSEKDKTAAQDVRLKAMERLAETKKRKSEDDEKKNKRRSNGTDTIAFLREKTEIETALRRDELELKKKEQDNELKKYEQLEHQQNAMVQMLERQSQQQQQQMQQFQMMFVQQQQQQSQIMMNLLDKLSSSKN